jgi:hypothetical protein
VATWPSTDLDRIISDFLDQLQRATELGWHRTKPDHYRAILAALESALKERQGSSAAPASAGQIQPAPDWAEPHPVAARIALALRWSLLPLLALVPSRSR